MTDCIFCRIINGEIPSKNIYEDPEILVFHDIRPLAPTHFLILPKKHIESLATCEESSESLLGRMLLLAPKLAFEQGLKGFRTMINTGSEGGQEVFHLHIHVFGGAKTLPKT